MRSVLSAACILVSVLHAACSGCPTAKSPEQRENWAEFVQKKELLPLDPLNGVSIKRDTREFVFVSKAATFADAFAKVLTDSKRQFGPIVVNRLPANLDKPFTKGEKFQGRYLLNEALEPSLGFDIGRFDLLCTIENEVASDFGIIAELEQSPQPGFPYTFKYRYLSGSPIAGSSTFIVEDLKEPGDLAKHCDKKADGAWVLKSAENRACEITKVTQVFIFQEQTASFRDFFATVGLDLHNKVVLSQVTQALDLIPGADLLSADIGQNLAARP